MPALARALGRAGIGHRVLGGEGPDARLTLVPVSLAKGLEFDHVIVAEPAGIAPRTPTACTSCTSRSPARCPG